MYVRRKGNTKWGRPMLYSAGPPIKSHTAFEYMVARLGLNINNEQELLSSPRLVAWIRRHGRTRYVPESLLMALGQVRDVEENISSALEKGNRPPAL